MIFLLFFSYFLLCQFIFNAADSYYLTSNSTKIIMPHWTEYASIFWVVSYVCEMIYQANKQATKKNLKKKETILYNLYNFLVFCLAKCELLQFDWMFIVHDWYDSPIYLIV